MSLEAAIQENTAVLRQLIAVLQSPAGTCQTEVATTAAVYSQQKAVTTEPPFTPSELKTAAAAVITEVANKPAEVAQATDAAASATASTAPAASTGDLKVAASYEDVAVAVRRLIAGGKREFVVDALRQFGCTNAKELRPEQYDEFLSCVAEPV